MNEQISQQLNQITLLLNECNITGIENMSRVLSVINIVSAVRKEFNEIQETMKDLNHQIESLKEDLQREEERHANQGMHEVIPMIPAEVVTEDGSSEA